MARFFRGVKDWISNQEIILIMLLLAIALINFPLQHYMSLARFQHYSISLGTVGLGFLAQVSFSWRRLGRWGRLTFVSSAIFMLVCAHFFWTNPWLGNPDLATEEQLWSRFKFAIMISLSAFPLAYFWWRWTGERNAKVAPAPRLQERSEN